MSQNLVDVVMTSYNKGPYIATAIESIFAQKTDKIAQIYICDDGSTDNSIETILGYQVKHPGKITLIQNQIKLGMCKNTRFSYAQGKSPFVASLDADDWWDNQNKIEIMVKALVDNPELIGCLHNFYVVNIDGKLVTDGPHAKLHEYFVDKFTKISMQDLLNVPLWASILFHGNFMLLRREIIDSIFTQDFIPKYDNSNIGDSFRFGIFNLIESKKIFGYFTEQMGTWRLNETSHMASKNQVSYYLNHFIVHPNYRAIFQHNKAINFICDYERNWYYPKFVEAVKQAKKNGQHEIVQAAYDRLINCGLNEVLDFVEFRKVFGEKLYVTMARDIRRIGLARYIYRCPRVIYLKVASRIRNYATYLFNILYHLRLYGYNKLRIFRSN
ncbi:MAG: glycosyltransferase [Candidatus Symbiobacter sp.]|nr:glycosyltransferase [Candidatus Symbiobacter sp.]